MHVVKVIGLIFLAAYLILIGLVNIWGVNVPGVAAFIIQGLAVAAGVLILISLGGLGSCCDSRRDRIDRQ